MILAHKEKLAPKETLDHKENQVHGETLVLKEKEVLLVHKVRLVLEVWKERRALLENKDLPDPKVIREILVLLAKMLHRKALSAIW